MTINLNMASNFDITITNSINDKKLSIDFETKEINAAQIYDFLSYDKDKSYTISSNFDDIEEGNEKDYFSEIISIISSIADELNQLNAPAPDEDSSIHTAETEI